MESPYYPIDGQGNGLSFSLWKRFPLRELFNPFGMDKGVCLWDDFLAFGTPAVATGHGIGVSNGNAYDVFWGGTATVQQVDGLGGIVELFTTADNDEGVICGSYGSTGASGAPFLISTSAPKTLIFEARFKTDSIAASQTDIFVGLGEVSMGATDATFTDADAMADNDFLGFHRIAAATSGLTLGYRRSGGAAQTKADVGTLAADTYIKAGFIFDGTLLSVTPWINGVEKPSSKITAAQAAAATFPNDYLTLLAVAKGIDAGDHKLTLDWWCCGQLR